MRYIINNPSLKLNFFLLYILVIYTSFFINTQKKFTEPFIKGQSLSIFNKFIKKNSKLIPFNVKNNYTGEIKYFPPFSKE